MAAPPPPDFADNLEAARAHAFALLQAAVRDRRSAWRTLQLATVALDGAPSVRTVVLRGVDGAARALWVHTDQRSVKRAELAAEPRVMLHGYDPAAKLQLRLAGRATVHAGDARAAAGWAASHDEARACYASPDPPGTPAAAPPPAPVSAPGAEANFAVVTVTIDSLDWLWLSAAGHRRARFDWDAARGWQGHWLVP